MGQVGICSATSGLIPHSQIIYWCQVFLQGFTAGGPDSRLTQFSSAGSGDNRAMCAVITSWAFRICCGSNPDFLKYVIILPNGFAKYILKESWLCLDYAHWQWFSQAIIAMFLYKNVSCTTCYHCCSVSFLIPLSPGSVWTTAALLTYWLHNWLDTGLHTANYEITGAAAGGTGHGR